MIYIYIRKYIYFLNHYKAIPQSYWPHFLTEQKVKPGHGFKSLQIQKPNKNKKLG